ncbi:MAG: aspartate aminotransferase family protein [Candidatus Omnitrophica bacterium]|nr:aspartate aminotransferase family protein [Candidatus Omnitrophota bacterium]
MKQNDYLIPVYTHVGPLFVKGKGSFLWDEKNNRYLDLFPGWGVSILGHCHPKIVKAIQDQSRKLIHLPNNLRQEWQPLLAKTIVKSAFPGKVFFANSGTEVVEAALKLSRLYGMKQKRYEIVTMKNSFHGRTMGSVAATGQKKYQDPFKPLVPKFVHAEFNDLGDLRKKVTSQTVAVMLEPIQGEGGVYPATPEFIKGVARLCREKKLLLIFDEIQTGMGRTGKMYAYQHYHVTPDILLLSKGLGAGVPIGAMVVKKGLSDIMQPGHHASTFGGNPLVTRAAYEVYSVIEQDKVLTHVRSVSAYLHKKLAILKKESPLIKEVRACGLMVGIELKKPSYPVFTEALKNKLIVNATHENVLRIMPALTVTKHELDAGIGILRKVLKKIC